MIFALLLCSLFSFVLTFPVLSPAKRDVWDPPITVPNASTVWFAGSTYFVTWNTSDKPSEVTDLSGQVYLRINNLTQSTPLAQDFPLTAGQAQVTIPADTPPAEDWIVVLFGDSGNWSPPFTIKAPQDS